MTMQSLQTLTLTLSRPTGEGTAIVSFEHWQEIVQQTPTLNIQPDGGLFPLSHLMEEGRGEGL